MERAQILEDHIPILLPLLPGCSTTRSYLRELQIPHLKKKWNNNDYPTDYIKHLEKCLTEHSSKNVNSPICDLDLLNCSFTNHFFLYFFLKVIFIGIQLLYNVVIASLILCMFEWQKRKSHIDLWIVFYHCIESSCILNI